MKNLMYLLYLSLFIFSACNKEENNNNFTNLKTIPKVLIKVCHYDTITSTWNTITVNKNELKTHLAHGDLQGDCSERTYVPDNNFEQALIDLGYDDVLNDYVITKNISGINSLNIKNKNIYDLTGIKDFKSLETLFCNNNNLTNINLTQNTALKNLDCQSNNLISLDLTNNTELKWLFCMNNKLTSLNLRNRNNSFITTFNSSNNTLLAKIQVDDSEWSDAHIGWTKDAKTTY